MDSTLQARIETAASNKDSSLCKQMAGFGERDIRTAAEVVYSLVALLGQSMEYEIKWIKESTSFRVSISTDTSIKVSQLSTIVARVQGKLIEAYVYVDQQHAKGAIMRDSVAAGRLAIDFILLSEKAQYAKLTTFSFPKELIQVTEDMCDSIDRVTMAGFDTRQDKDLIVKLCKYFYNSSPNIPDIEVNLVFRMHKFINPSYLLNTVNNGSTAPLQIAAPNQTSVAVPPADTIVSEVICDVQFDGMEKLSWSFLEYVQESLPARVHDIQLSATLESGLNARAMVLKRNSTFIQNRSCFIVTPRSTAAISTVTSSTSAFKARKRARPDDDFDTERSDAAVNETPPLKKPTRSN